MRPGGITRALTKEKAADNRQSIANWVGLEILVDPLSLATTGEIRIRANLLADIGFRYALAFCDSADSGAK
jgi:hypothetical protein